MNPRYKNPAADIWYQNLLRNPAEIPFSFQYDGKVYTGFSPVDFTLTSQSAETDPLHKKEIHKFFFMLDNHLHVRIDCAHYPDFGASDFIVYFSNPSKENSGILSDVRFSMRFFGKYPVLKGIMGDLQNKYRPYAMDLTSGPVHFESNTGRPTHIRFPYFNLEHGDSGTMLAIGWSGSWKSDFRYESNTGETVWTAQSVNNLRTYLKPGEEIRTALFVCAPYTQREENFSTNYWRSWFQNCNLPSADGKGTPVQPFSTCCLAHDTGLPNSDGSISERYTTWRPSLKKMIQEDVKVDFRWVDAGWYIAPDGSSPDGATRENDWHSTVGTWEMDPVKWPGNTFRESTDFARANGMKTLLWFEPEKVCDVENLAKKYGYNPAWAPFPSNPTWSPKGRTSNIGNPDCFKWTLDRICKTLTENRVEMYREDNNQKPAEQWRLMDELEGENRCGITEAKVVHAHYQLWDSIIACTTSYGGCGFVDSCAGGGGRNDLESLRRGIPLLRSDSDRETTARRLSMTTSFNRWIPFCGAPNKEKKWQLDPTGVVDQYVWRASYLPVMQVDSQFVQDPEQDFSVLRKGLHEWRSISTYLTKDFYVHTPWHTDTETSGFTAYSFFNPETQKGILLVFRQETCLESTLSITLPYQEPGMECVVTDVDTHQAQELEYTQMQQDGLIVTLDEPRSARLFYVEIKGDHNEKP